MKISENKKAQGDMISIVGLTVLIIVIAAVMAIVFFKLFKIG